MLRHFFLGPDRFPNRFPALQPLLWESPWQWLIRHFCPYHTPGAWNDAIEIVSAATQCYPTPITVGMCQLVCKFHLCLDAAHGKLQVSQRVPGVCITAMLADDNIRSKRCNEWEQEGINSLDV